MECIELMYPWLHEAGENLACVLSKPSHPKICGLLEPTELGADKLALRISLDILCEAGTFPACQNCRSCQLLREMTHPDHTLAVLGATNYQLGWVESLRYFVGSHPQIGHRKVVILPQIQGFHGAAKSALLHLLESIPEYLYVFFTGNGVAARNLACALQAYWAELEIPVLKTSLNWLEHQAVSIPSNSAILLRWLDWSQGSPLLVQNRLAEGGIFAQEDAFAKIISEQIVHPQSMNRYLHELDQLTKEQVELGLYYAIEAWRLQFGCPHYPIESWSQQQLECLTLLQTQYSKKALVRAIECGATFNAQCNRVPSIHHPLLRRRFLSVMRMLRGACS